MAHVILSIDETTIIVMIMTDEWQVENTFSDCLGHERADQFKNRNKFL